MLCALLTDTGGWEESGGDVWRQAVWEGRLQNIVGEGERNHSQSRWVHDQHCTPQQQEAVKTTIGHLYHHIQYTCRILNSVSVITEWTSKHMWISLRKRHSIVSSNTNWDIHIDIWLTFSPKAINVPSVHAFEPIGELNLLLVLLSTTLKSSNPPTPPILRRSLSRMSSLHLIWGWWHPAQHNKEIPGHRSLLPGPTRWVRTPHCQHDPKPPLERWRCLSR